VARAPLPPRGRRGGWERTDWCSYIQLLGKHLVDMRPITLMISYVLALALMRGIELIMVEYDRRPQYTPVKRLLVPQRPATLVRYNRRFCSGLGDRIAVILNVAAFALSMNASCFVFWCEVSAASSNCTQTRLFSPSDAPLEIPPPPNRPNPPLRPTLLPVLYAFIPLCSATALSISR
jgi:hypothetical protein